MAVVRAGSGKRKAVFRAELPHPGEWQLEYHLPGARTGRGTWTLEVTGADGETQDVRFDADNGVAGWNPVGTFEVGGGETVVAVPDKADNGRFVLADAIRWTPLSRPDSDRADASR